MTFKQKNITVSLVNFSLILVFFLFRLIQLAQNDNFNATPIFRLWGIIIGLAIVVTIAVTILTHIVSAIITAVKTGKDDPKLEDFEDERDKLIDLKGTQVTYTVSSLGGFLAMLTFVFGQPPLVMFCLLIFFGVLAQMIGDLTRLIIYQRGF
jgi:uncharacterized membrane protein (DUF485 family)